MGQIPRSIERISSLRTVEVEEVAISCFCAGVFGQQSAAYIV